MNKLKYVFRNEGLLLLRNKFLALPLLINILYWGYVIISYEIQPIHFEERAAAFYQSFMWILLLNLLIVGLLAVYMASKDRESDFEQLVVTYEVKNVEWILGKWLITQLYGLCVALITIIVQALWFVSSVMTIGEWFKNIFYVFIQMEGAFFLLISIGFLFGILIKSMLAYVSIPAILVLSLLLPFDYTGQAYIWDNPKFHLLTPFDYMFIESPYEGIWGIHHVFKGSLFHQGATVLLGIVVIILALLLFRRNRKSYKEKKMITIIATIIIIPTIVLSGMRFMQYDRALKQYIATGQQYAKSFDGEGNYDEWMNSYYEEYKDDQPYDFAMKKTNLSVEFQADDHIKVDSTLTIKNRGHVAENDVFLTLYHGLEIKECKSEKSVSCSRENDFITLHFDQMIQPDEDIVLNLNYEGEILQYRDFGYIEQAFIKKERMYLPKEAGWYPLIGKRPLAVAREHNNLYAQFELRDARLIEDFPTEYTVNIARENQKVPIALTIPEMSENVFQGTSQYGLSLVGGNFKEKMVGNIRVVAHPEVFNGAKEVIERYQKAWSFTEDWLEVSLSPSVIYLLSDNYYYQIHNSVNHDFLVMRNENVDDSEIVYDLLNELFRDNGVNGDQDFYVFYNALEWLIINNFQEQVGFADWYKANWWGSDEDLTLVNLMDSYEKKGLESFKEVIKYLFDYWKELDNKQGFNMQDAIKQYEGESKQ